MTIRSELSTRRPGTTKLCEIDVVNIKSLLKLGWTQAAIAERYRVSQRTVSSIKRGESWSQVQVDAARATGES